MMAACQALQTNGKLDVARAHNVLDLEIGELGIEPQLLDDSRVLARCEFRIVFRLGAGHDHLARREDESGCLGFTDAHDDGRETLEESAGSQDRHVMLPSVPWGCTRRFSHAAQWS